MPTFVGKPLMLRAALFSAALVMGYVARHPAIPAAALPTPTAESPEPEPFSPIRPPHDPDNFHNAEVRGQLAGEILDADTGGLRRIATRLLDTPETPTRAWVALFRQWVNHSPADAWDFANSHADFSFPRSDRTYLWGGSDKPPICGFRELTVFLWGQKDPRTARDLLEGPQAPEFPFLVAGALKNDPRFGFGLLDEMAEAGLSIPGNIFADPFDIEWENWNEARLAELARLDPDAAIRWARKLDHDWANDFIHTQHTAIALAGWFGSDCDAALAWLNQQPDAARIIEDLSSGLTNHRLYQPRLLDLLIARLPEGNTKWDRVTRLVSDLVWLSPDLAAKEIRRALPTAALRAEALAKAARLMDDEPTKALDLLFQIEKGVSSYARQDIPTAEVMVDGDRRSYSGPMSYAMQLAGYGQCDDSDQLISILIGNVFWRDPDEGKRLLERLPPESLATTGSDAIEAWASHDPLESAKWLARKIQAPIEDGASTVGDWFGDADLSQQEIRDLATTLPEGPFRKAFSAWAVTKIEDEQPENLIAFARATGGGDDAVTNAYGQYARKDFDAALAALSADPAPPGAAWKALAEALPADDPEADAGLLDQLDSGPVRDEVLIALADKHKSPDGSWRQAEYFCALANETTRRRRINDLLDRMSLNLTLARDPATIASLHELIDASATMSDAERERWHAHIGVLFPDPP